MSDYLFHKFQLVDHFRNISLIINEEVERMPEAQFQNTTDEEIKEYVTSKHQIVPLEIYEDDIKAEKHEVKIRYKDYEREILVDGLRFEITIPYTGDNILWEMKPSTWRLTFPEGSIEYEENRGLLKIHIESPIDSASERFNLLLDKNLDNIKFHLNAQKKDIEKFNTQLPTKIQEAIQKRKAKLEKQSNIINTFKIPLKKRTDAPDINLIPIKKKFVKPLPPVSHKIQQYDIKDEDYEYILKVIRHEGITYESTPGTFINLCEEDLRNIILAHLNGHYEGDATGETFRKSGKTDIRIEFEGRSAFVGECKIWRGEKKLIETIDQLLGYLTWRDCKTSIILFNKEIAGFSSIQQKIPIIFKNHVNYFDKIRSKHAGEWRYILKSKDDTNQHVIIHVFLFNLHVKKV